MDGLREVTRDEALELATRSLVENIKEIRSGLERFRSHFDNDIEAAITEAADVLNRPLALSDRACDSNVAALLFVADQIAISFAVGDKCFPTASDKLLPTAQLLTGIPLKQLEMLDVDSRREFRQAAKGLDDTGRSCLNSAKEAWGELYSAVISIRGLSEMLLSLRSEHGDIQPERIDAHLTLRADAGDRSQPDGIVHSLEEPDTTRSSAEVIDPPKSHIADETSEHDASARATPHGPWFAESPASGEGSDWFGPVAGSVENFEKWLNEAGVTCSRTSIRNRNCKGTWYIQQIHCRSWRMWLSSAKLYAKVTKARLSDLSDAG